MGAYRGSELVIRCKIILHPLWNAEISPIFSGLYPHWISILEGITRTNKFGFNKIYNQINWNLINYRCFRMMKMKRNNFMNWAILLKSSSNLWIINCDLCKSIIHGNNQRVNKTKRTEEINDDWYNRDHLSIWVSFIYNIKLKDFQKKDKNYELFMYFSSSKIFLLLVIIILCPRRQSSYRESLYLLEFVRHILAIFTVINFASVNLVHSFFFEVIIEQRTRISGLNVFQEQ